MTTEIGSRASANGGRFSSAGSDGPTARSYRILHRQRLLRHHRIALRGAVDVLAIALACRPRLSDAAVQPGQLREET